MTPSWYICLCSEIVEAIREELSYFLSTKSPNVYAHVPTLYLFFLLKWQCVLAPIRKMSLFELGIPSLLSEGNLSSVSIPFTWSVSLFLSLSHSHKPKTIFQNFSVETQWNETKQVTTKLSISLDPSSLCSYQTVLFPFGTQFLKLLFRTCISSSPF